MNVIFIAPPGAGKGTYSKLLTEKYDFNHITTGYLIRKEINKETKLGKNIKQNVENGNFISDSIIKELVKKEMINLKGKNIILDGYPRNINQIKDYEDIKKELNVDNELVINIKIDKEEALKRTLGRIICPNCGTSYNTLKKEFMPKQENICDKCNHKLEPRKDDNETTFNKRFNTYLKNTAPILDYFKNKNILIEINNNEQIKNSYKKMIEAIDDKIKN